MEIIVYLLDLSDVLILHLPSCCALPAWVVLLREHHLIDHDVVDVNVELCQLNSQSLSFVQGKELRDANGNECGLIGVLELLIYLFNLFLGGVQGHEQLLLSILILTSS